MRGGKLEPEAEAALRATRLDEARLNALREIAGPDVWPDILSQLQSDLEEIRHSLSKAAEDDAALVRAQTHVLMAVAGTAGGIRLHRLAEVLNQAAHGAERPLGQLVRLTVSETEELAILLRNFAATGDRHG